MRKACLLLACLLFLLSMNMSAETASLTVDLNAPLIDMSQTLYGLFFEDINFTADGGLYAELLRNRSFENRSFPEEKPFDAYTGWLFNERMAADGTATLMTEAPLHPNNPRYMRLELQSEGYRVVNEGYAARIGQAGIPLKAGLAYNGAVYLRNVSYTGRVQVHLKGRRGEALSDSVTLNPTAEWARLPFCLTALADEDAMLVFTFMGTGIVDMDMASLFPGDAYGAGWPNGGLRADLVEALRELKPRFIRFPGGCVAEGSYHPDNIYRWKDTIGPIEQRRENENTWGGMQSYGLGFHEYFQLCEDLGAEPVPVVSAAMVCQVRGTTALPLLGDELQSYIRDVLDLVEYARGDVTTPWGAKRAENGHPAPFALNYLAIGNENWGSEYFYRYGLIAKAVREQYPDLTLIVAAGPVAEGDLIRDSWAAIRRQYPADLVDEHYYMPSRWFLDNTARYDSYPRGGNPVFLGEYAAHEPAAGGKRPNNLFSALAEAAYLTGIERNSDLVTLACYAPLLAREGFAHWTPNLLWFDGRAVLKTPNYHVQAMFSNTLGTQVLDSKLVGEGLYQVATRDEDRVIIKLVNPSANQRTLSLVVKGLDNSRGASLTLSGEPHQTNTFQSPDTLRPLSGEVRLEHGAAQLTLPAWSVTVITLPIQ